MEEQIIEFVRSNPLLYDRKHPAYKNQISKDRKWMEFSKAVNVPVPELKKRWKAMRDRFFRIRKIERAAESGNEDMSIDRKCYKHYESLKFLSAVEAPDVKNDNIVYTEIESIIEKDLSGCSDIYVEYEASNSSYGGDGGSLIVFPTKQSNVTIEGCTLSDAEHDDIPSSTVSAKRQTDTEMELAMMNVLKKIKSSASENVTPFRTFLDSIALTVEQANCSIAQQTRIQMKILKAVQDELENAAQATRN